MQNDRVWLISHLFFLAPAFACFALALYDQLFWGLAGLGLFILFFYFALLISGRQRRRLRRQGIDLP